MRQLCMPMPTIMDASDAVSTEMPCGNFIQDRGRERGKEKGRGGHRPSALLGRLVTNICPSHTYNFLACLLLHCIVTSFLLWCIKDSQLVVSQNIQDLAKESQPPEPLCMTRVVKFCHMFTSLKNSAGEGGRGREEFYISPTPVFMDPIHSRIAIRHFAVGRSALFRFKLDYIQGTRVIQFDGWLIYEVMSTWPYQ